MNKFFKYLLGLTILAVPSLAFAQFTPPPDDISVKILDQLFGGLFNGGNDMFGAGILVFNGAILTIGGILAAYTVLAGTLGTAHDGEMLGKKFSSVWIPIRYSVGTALVLPVLPGGYCMMSKLVAMSISIGIGLAGAVWDGFLENPTQQANVSFPTTSRAQVITLAENAFKASICVNGYQKFINDSQTENSVLNFARYSFSKSVDTDGNYTYGHNLNSTACGKITNPKLDPVPATSAATNGASTNTGYLGSLDNLFKPVDISSMTTASKVQTATLVGAMDALSIQALADTNIKNNGATYYKKIVDAADKYMLGMKTAAQNIPQSHETNEKKYGWILAGAYFNNIVLTNNEIHKSLENIPDSSASTSLTLSGMPSEDVAHYLISDSVLKNNEIKQLVGSVSSTEEESSGKDGAGMSAWIGNQLAKLVSGIDLIDLKNDARHPVIIINEMGTRILGVWTGFMALTVATEVTAQAVKDESGTIVGQVVTVGGLVPVSAGAGAVIAAINTTLKFVMAPITALLVVGFVCAYLIPMIPFIMWLGAVGGWVIQCIIAIIVAPLWAVMHLHPNGDDLTGHGGNGYSMLMGLLLRPALLIFGFIASIAVSSVLGEFINKIYFQVFVFSGANVNGWLAFITMLAGTTIYAVIMFSFIKKTHSIMHVIPDEIMKWIGGGSDAVGNYAQSMGEGAERSGMGAAAALGSGGLLGVGLKKAGENLQEDTKIVKDSIKFGKLEKANALKAEKEAQTQNENKALGNSFNAKHGENAHEKRTNGLGFDFPKTGSDQMAQKQNSELNSYNTAMDKISSSSAGASGIESFQNQMVQSKAENHIKYGGVATDAIKNISESIISGANVTPEPKPEPVVIDPTKEPK